MTTSKFKNEALRIADKLQRISCNINRTVELLERLLNAEGEVEIEEWAVRAGKIFITFASPVEIVNVPPDEEHIQRTLKVLFPTCQLSGTQVEIEAGELL